VTAKIKSLEISTDNLESVHVTFEIEEKSHIAAKGTGYYKEHNQLSDAMVKAANWLASQPVGAVVTITETTTITKKSS